MSSWQWLLWLAAILVVGVALRFYQLGQVPVSLYWDETAILVDARAVAATGQDMHGNHWLQAIFPSYGDYKLPVYIWLASLSVKTFGASEWAVRLPNAVAGLGTIFISGAIVWQLFPKLVLRRRQSLALLTMAGLAITPWSILFSRTGFEGHLGQFLLAASLWLALKSRQNRWWLLGSVLFGSLATYSYYSVRFVWPVVFAAAVLLITPPTKQRRWRQLAVGLALPLVLYAASLLPIQRSPLYEASQQFRLSTDSVLNAADWPVESNSYKLQAGNGLIDKLTYHPWVLRGRELAKNYSDNLSFDLLFVSGDSNLRHGTGRHGLFLWPLFIPFLYGWYTIFHKHWRQGSWLLIWWLAALLPASVPEETPHALRSLNALVPLSVVIGWGAWQLWLAPFVQRFKKLSLLAAATITALLVFDFTSYYFQAYPAASAADWQAGYKELAATIWQSKDAVDEVWVQPFDGRFYLWLMAYQLPPEAYQQLAYRQYQPLAIDNLHFQRFAWETLLGERQNIMIVDEQASLDHQLETAPLVPQIYQTVLLENGQPAYAMAIFESSK